MRAFVLGLLAVSCLAMAGVAGSGSVAAAGTVTVRPADLNGWVIDPDGTVAFGFLAGPATVGTGSLQFGPIDGTNPANKFIMFAPVDGLVSDLVSLSYDFYVGAGSYQHFYTNVYVDSSANGVGTFATFYDCRYDLVPASGPAGSWSTNGFTATSAWTNVANPLGSCPATLAGLPAGSEIIGVVVNGGQSNASDAGLEGGFDNVVVTSVADGTTIYDFEPALPEATSKEQCKKNGWTSVTRADASPFKTQGDCVQYVNTGK
jgi:hypothetical protein